MLYLVVGLLLVLAAPFFGTTVIAIIAFEYCPWPHAGALIVVIFAACAYDVYHLDTHRLEFCCALEALWGKLKSWNDRLDDQMADSLDPYGTDTYERRMAREKEWDETIDRGYEDDEDGGTKSTTLPKVTPIVAPPITPESQEDLPTYSPATESEIDKDDDPLAEAERFDERKVTEIKP